MQVKTKPGTANGDSRPERVVSLLPALTELVCELGFQHKLVGRSHECDYPPSVQDLPVLTAPKYTAGPDADGKSIHKNIRELLRKALSIYEVNESRLETLSPDVILTQDHCEVCAVSLKELDQSVKNKLKPTTEIVSVSPSDLESVFASFITISDHLGAKERGENLVKTIRSRFDEINEAVNKLQKPDVVAIEWMEPVMTGGNWMPELIEIAGGRSLLATAGKHSPWTDMSAINKCNPDILLIVPCGYSIQKTIGEISALTEKEGWDQIAAVQKNQVYILDGNHYFNRPGPRLRDSAEILGHIFHPSQIADPTNGAGWKKLKSGSNIHSQSNP